MHSCWWSDSLPGTPANCPGHRSTLCPIARSAVQLLVLEHHLKQDHQFDERRSQGVTRPVSTHHPKHQSLNATIIFYGPPIVSHIIHHPPTIVWWWSWDVVDGISLIDLRPGFSYMREEGWHGICLVLSKQKVERKKRERKRNLINIHILPAWSIQ